LNPIEDEAVVASALLKYHGFIELLSVDLPGFKFRSGLNDWKVMTEKLEDAEQFEEYTKIEDVPVDYAKKRCIKETMFAGHYEEGIRKELSKCLRVMPHDQNTSGFFITIIRKIKDFDNNLED
jgi:16S rRNA C967 or C1407 C5-methylase (RsmB/RsmF family)